eukprot:SAG11_NODE_1602_length_4600_cov_1.859587_5_plen_811_part_00
MQHSIAGPPARDAEHNPLLQVILKQQTDTLAQQNDTHKQHMETMTDTHKHYMETMMNVTMENMRQQSVAMKHVMDVIGRLSPGRARPNDRGIDAAAVPHDLIDHIDIENRTIGHVPSPRDNSAAELDMFMTRILPANDLGHVHQHQVLDRPQTPPRGRRKPPDLPALGPARITRLVSDNRSDNMGTGPTANRSVSKTPRRRPRLNKQAPREPPPIAEIAGELCVGSREHTARRQSPARASRPLGPPTDLNVVEPDAAHGKVSQRREIAADFTGAVDDGADKHSYESLTALMTGEIAKLRAELLGVKAQELRKQASGASVNADTSLNTSSATDPREALLQNLKHNEIATTKAKRAALRQELHLESLLVLKRRARAAGVAADTVEGVDAEDDPKGVIIELLVSQETATRAERLIGIGPFGLDSPQSNASVRAPEPEVVSDQPAFSRSAASPNAKAARVLLRGLRSGELEEAVSKMEEESKKSATDTERIVGAKSSVRNLQVAVTVLVMLSTILVTLVTNHLLGATGFDDALSLSLGVRCGAFVAGIVFMQMELWSAAMRDTEFVPRAAERVLRPVLGGLGHFLWGTSLWSLMDLQNPEEDIALISGGPGVVCYILGALTFFDHKSQLIEIWRLYRCRNVKLPPYHKTWSEMTSAAGRGTFVAMVAVSVVLNGFGTVIYATLYIPIRTYFDKAATVEEHGHWLDQWHVQYFFVIAVPALLLALVWAKEWPSGVRDPVSVVVLCALQEASLYMVRLHNFRGMDSEFCVVYCESLRAQSQPIGMIVSTCRGRSRPSTSTAGSAAPTAAARSAARS